MSANAYDLMVVGTGPAGLTAALYAQRLGLSTVVFGDTPGGITYMIENLVNFPGFLGGISGTEFGVKLFQQAQMDGAAFTMSLLDRLESDGDRFAGTDANGLVYTASCALVATGRVPKRLPAVHSKMRGVNFCSVCDGPLFRGKNATLAVVGSDNAAAQHAVTLSRIADRVYLVCRSRTLKMDAAHRATVQAQANIEVLQGTEATGFTGLDEVEALVVRDKDGQTREIPVDGVFLAIGWTPNLKMLKVHADTDPEGYLLCDEQLMTSASGLFAAGDVRKKHLYQVLTACADGSLAAKHAAEHLERVG